ncbi:MAG: hypothetical protein AAFX99_31365, partial [Myxococcota bacterium]
MLTIPTDFQSAPTTTLDHAVRQLSSGCLVAYRSLKPPQPISALFTRATLIHVRRGTKVMSTHARRGAVHVHQDSVVFVPPGLRVMSELLDKRGRYESTVISFDPAFVAHTLPALLHSDPGNSLPPWVLDPTP